MSRSNPRYHMVAIWLHWIMAIAIIAMIGIGLYMTDLPKEAPGLFALVQLHKSIGISLLFLAIARILWAVLNPPPPSPPMPGWQKLAAKSVHWAFYALMLLVPLSGWLIVSTSSSKLPTLIFDTVPWPHLPVALELHKFLHKIAEEAHEIMAKLIGLLLILHVGAALKHQFVEGNDLLGRMVPLSRFFRSDPPERAARGALLVFAVSVAIFLLIVVPYALIAPAGQTGKATDSGAAARAELDADGMAVWRMSSQNGRIGFAGEHEGKQFAGLFREWSGEAFFDKSRPEDASLSLRIASGSAQTGSNYYDRTLKLEDWFDAGNFPEMSFVASGFEPLGVDSYRIAGGLSFRGKEYPVSFTARIGAYGEPYDDDEHEHDYRRMTASGALELDRLDLGIGARSDPDAGWVGRKVVLDFFIRAERSGHGKGDDDEHDH